MEKEIHMMAFIIAQNLICPCANVFFGTWPNYKVLAFTNQNNEGCHRPLQITNLKACFIPDTHDQHSTDEGTWDREKNTKMSSYCILENCLPLTEKA